MRRLAALLLALTVIPAFARPVRAEHDKITLEVKSTHDKQVAYVDQTPPESGKNPRPVLKAKVGETLRVQWFLTNVYPHKTLPDVVVHSYIARQGKVGQKDLPDLKGDDVVIETAYELDLKPGAKTGARYSVKIDTPGAYLLRVETRNTGSDHEHFSAIDLLIEP